MALTPHPIVADIVASFSGHTVPPVPAFEAACELVSRAPAAEREDIAVDLVAVAIKLHKSMGAAGQDAIAAFAHLAAILIGAQKTEAALISGGMSKATASVVGAEVVSRAPRAPEAAATTVKAKRGLSRKESP